MPDGDGLVVELGGGTGAVTQALLDHGFARERLVVVERSPRLCGICVPTVRTCRSCRVTQCGSITCFQSARIDAIVSCMRERLLPQQDVTVIVDQCHRRLACNGVMIQFTSDLRPPGGNSLGHMGLVASGSSVVWANILPARIVMMGRHSNEGNE